jgi:hypothetical protein
LAKSTPKFRSLLDVINLKASEVPKNVVGTIFAPNDAVSVCTPGCWPAKTVTAQRSGWCSNSIWAYL